MKRRQSVDVAPVLVVPAPQGWTQTATGKIVPLAQSAAALAVPLAQNAAAKAGPLAQSAVALATPLAHNAADRAGQAVTFASPYAQQAVTFASPYAQQAAGAVTPYATLVAGKVTPYAELAAGRLAPLASSGVHAAQEAVEKIGPAVEAARDKVSDDLLPLLSTALTSATSSPAVVEATRRGRATVAAARGELSLPEPPPEDLRSGSWVTRVAVVAAVAGLAVVVVRKLVGRTQDSGWQSARPSAPYTPPVTPAAEPVTVDQDVPLVSPPDASTTSVDPTVGESTSPATASPYGPGSYVGFEPPEGFVVKGNESSMKYHLPNGAGYDQTVAEVWFDSESAAERSGFVRAEG